MLPDQGTRDALIGVRVIMAEAADSRPRDSAGCIKAPLPSESTISIHQEAPPRPPTVHAPSTLLLRSCCPRAKRAPPGVLVTGAIPALTCGYVCSPDGIRTRATALRGRRPGPLDNGAVQEKNDAAPAGVSSPPAGDFPAWLGYQDSNLD